MSKFLLQLVAFVLASCFVAEPMVPSIPPRLPLWERGGQLSQMRSAEEALAPVLASARIPFNHVRSALGSVLTALAYRQNNWFGWPLQAELAHVAEATHLGEFHRGNSKGSLRPSLGERLSLTFFAKNQSEEPRGTETPDIDQRILRLLRGFLSDPEHSDEFAKKLIDTLDEESQFDIELGRKLLMRVLPRVNVSPAKAITILEKGKGKAAIVKLPLRLQELKAILNSPAERFFALFRAGSARYLVISPGSAGEMEYGPMISYPAAQGAEFFMFAKALGHSHPRFMLAEPSEPDLVRDKKMDTFILALVDLETIEVTLWRANETDYLTQRGPEALKLLVHLGLLAPEETTWCLPPLRLLCVAVLFALGSVMAHSTHLERSIGLIVRAALGEKQSEATPYLDLPLLRRTA